MTGPDRAKHCLAVLYLINDLLLASAFFNEVQDRGSKNHLCVAIHYWQI